MSYQICQIVISLLTLIILIIMPLLSIDNKKYLKFVIKCKFSLTFLKLKYYWAFIRRKHGLQFKYCQKIDKLKTKCCYTSYIDLRNKY